jgi:hypothetical protein
MKSSKECETTLDMRRRLFCSSHAGLRALNRALINQVHRQAIARSLRTRMPRVVCAHADRIMHAIEKEPNMLHNKIARMLLQGRGQLRMPSKPAYRGTILILSFCLGRRIDLSKDGTLTAASQTNERQKRKLPPQVSAPSRVNLAGF